MLSWFSLRLISLGHDKDTSIQTGSITTCGNKSGSQSYVVHICYFLSFKNKGRKIWKLQIAITLITFYEIIAHTFRIR